MRVPGYRHSLLVAYFREFYAEIIAIKESLKGEREFYASQAGPEEAEGPKSLDTWQRLLSVLEQQALDAGRSGGAFAFEVYREAQYIMASLADETFLHMEWEGRKDWPLLESKLFHSHAAGQLFFDKLDRLLQRKDPVYADLAAVYFMALALGFQGKFRDTEGTSQLDQYKQRLFLMIFRRQPALLSEDARLFPQSYLHTLRESRTRRLPNPRKWLGLLAAIFVVWLILSQVLWLHLTGDLSGVICSINPVACGAAKVQR